jgi:hypothetical protein
MSMQYAAHVGHPVLHSSNAAQIAMGAVAATGTAAAVYFTVGGALPVICYGAAGGTVGVAAGSVVDGARSPSAECFIVSGIDSVRLGPSFKPAARAEADETKVQGWHEEKLAEGSETVMLGPGCKPMSRRGDRVDIKCGGTILDGIPSILVGGAPSKQGVTIPEQSSNSLKALSVAFDLIGAGQTIAARGALNFALGALQIGGVIVGGDTGNVMSAAGTAPPTGGTKLTKTIDWINFGITHGKGAISAWELVKP